MLEQPLTKLPTPSSREFIPPGSRFLSLPEVFPMRHGGCLKRGILAFETWGTLSRGRDNAILILTGLSPDAHAASSPTNREVGWWERMVGPGKAIDTDTWFVICVNSLGSCKGSSGPASLVPDNTLTYRLDFPQLSIEDIADAAAFAVRALEIETLACVIGCSMGGMSALSLISRHPGLARTHISVSSAAHAAPFALAVRSLQRQAIQDDPNWRSGQYSNESYPLAGMSIARKLGLITYRSATEWQARFGRNLAASGSASQRGGVLCRPEFAVESYLECHTRRFLRGFDPNSYLYLSQCIDLFDLADHENGCADRALSQLTLERALVLGTDTDILFPLYQQRQIADGLRAAGARTQFTELDSHQGHDAFLVDIPSFGAPIASFLSDLGRKSPVVRAAPVVAPREEFVL
ncbi:homoserine O-acetyltransferase [uncultured Tateyamaria sp.]|uniref:homoserine O-acetyltransferase MetX n=1 Tax=uncultured Tateyamaria sp. TaxID=455651 RepID=UPI00260EA47D|nr:homoserine O-acetyltransferase [uncultured Tateyamaria sp.]